MGLVPGSLGEQTPVLKLDPSDFRLPPSVSFTCSVGQTECEQPGVSLILQGPV